MPNFKPKTNKKLLVNNSSSNTSLDNKHEKLLDIFQRDLEVTIPQLKVQRNKLKDEFEKKNMLFEKKIEIKGQINFIDAKINEIKRNKKDYLLNNSKYIFEYFQTKKNISEGSSSGTKKLDSFFNINVNDTSLNANNISKSNIQKYFTNVSKDHVDMKNFINPIDICQKCKKGELIPIDYEGIMVCNSCFNNTRFLVDNDKPTYKEPPKEVCFYAYKRINHFREILAQFQAKETTLIPLDVIENIKLQIKKERLQIKTMNNKKTKDVLKKLGYNKYYEHIPFIKDKLGIKPPVMSQGLEETLCNLFIDIQAPYAKYCPEDRVNFLNYYYTIYKLCELLNQKQFLPYFPMLKDREKRIEQDEIWKNICKELNWKFISTI